MLPPLLLAVILMLLPAPLAAPRPPPLAVRSVVQLEGGTRATSAGRYTNVKLGRDGLPLVLYNRDRGGIVRAQHCADSACAQRTATNLSAPTSGSAGRFIDLAMAQNGLPLAVWAGPYIHLALCTTPDCAASSGGRVLHQAAGAYPSIAIGDDGRPRVAYYLETGALQLATCADPLCCANKPSGVCVASTATLASGPGMGKYPSLAICSGGRPCAAYQDSYAGHLMFVACADAACSSVGTPVTIDASGTQLGTYISMKVGVDGRPVMMYADERTGAIKVAACRSADCGQGAPTISTIDHAGVGCYGEFPELDISRLTGFPILSYFNQTSTTSGGLRITQCGDADCSTAALRTSQTALTGKCGFGRDTSIAIGHDGSGAPAVFVSFLDYNGGGSAKRASLAVLGRGAGSASLRGQGAQVRAPPSGKNDICQGVVGE